MGRVWGGDTKMFRPRGGSIRVDSRKARVHHRHRWVASHRNPWVGWVVEGRHQADTTTDHHREAIMVVVVVVVTEIFREVVEAIEIVEEGDHKVAARNAGDTHRDHVTSY